MKRTRVDGWLAAVVFGHFLISIVHGAAHEGAHVALGRASSLFVYLVILAGPFVGLALSIVRRALGAGIVAASMAGALVFGLLNHFIIVGGDHVSQVAADWRQLFAVTAALLFVFEAAGVAVALRLVRTPLEELS